MLSFCLWVKKKTPRKSHITCKNSTIRLQCTKRNSCNHLEWFYNFQSRGLWAILLMHLYNFYSPMRWFYVTQHTYCNCPVKKQRYVSLNCFKIDKNISTLFIYGQKLTRKKKPGFTWCGGTCSNNARNRIDYFFNVHFCYIYLRRPSSVSNVRVSHHIALSFKCEISYNSRRKGYWKKLDTSVLLKIQ